MINSLPPCNYDACFLYFLFLKNPLCIWSHFPKLDVSGGVKIRSLRKSSGQTIKLMELMGKGKGLEREREKERIEILCFDKLSSHSQFYLMLVIDFWRFGWPWRGPVCCRRSVLCLLCLATCLYGLLISCVLYITSCLDLVLLSTVCFWEGDTSICWHLQTSSNAVFVTGWWWYDDDGCCTIFAQFFSSTSTVCVFSILCPILSSVMLSNIVTVHNFLILVSILNTKFKHYTFVLH